VVKRVAVVAASACERDELGNANYSYLCVQTAEVDVAARQILLVSPRDRCCCEGHLRDGDASAMMH
jgi:hypothetical protein